ncbi:FAD:protein FMN transferase [Rhodoferax sp.]|uniref:FAD:protein FMN transferase n=1 Tax=Rhodoferax sp. TaxID=50421 RepID=UPI00276AC27A|nr:FAD:protein FMN transferase [Rhodoferax sp.]
MSLSIVRIFFEAMACRCEVRLAAQSDANARILAQPALEEVRRIEGKYSRYRADSVVSRINAQAALDWVECDDETLALLDYADTLFTLSAGLFDVTAGVLRRAWNFRHTVVPTAEPLRALCELIDWRRVQRDTRRVRLPVVGMELDFGGFGKEYAADRAAQALLTQGVRHGYINLGGDIRVLGPKPGSEPWTIGIQDPRQASQLIASIALTDGALATSGDYERYFELAGRRYGHILHPRNGQPVDYWRSVSVLAPSALLAGSFATIAMLKQADGLAFLDGAGVAYLAVDHAGVVHRDKDQFRPAHCGNG